MHWKESERGESSGRSEKGETSVISQKHEWEKAPSMLTLLSIHVQQFLEGEIKVIV